MSTIKMVLNICIKITYLFKIKIYKILYTLIDGTLYSLLEKY